MNNKKMLVIITDSIESSKYNVSRFNDNKSVVVRVKEYTKRIDENVYEKLKPKFDELLNKDINVKEIYELLSNLNKILKDLRVAFILFDNYENDLHGEGKKESFQGILDYLVSNNHYIYEDTLFLYDCSYNDYVNDACWAWSNDIDDLIDYYKYVILDRMFSFEYKANIGWDKLEDLSINELLQNLIWVEDIDKTNKFGRIQDLLVSLDNNRSFENFEYVVEEIQKQSEILGVTSSVYVFKGLKYPKMICKINNKEYDEKNLYKTFKEY